MLERRSRLTVVTAKQQMNFYITERIDKSSSINWLIINLNFNNEPVLL